MIVTLQKLKPIFMQLAAMPEEQIEGFHHRIEEAAPGLLARAKDSGLDADVAEATAVILYMMLEDATTPGESGNPIKDIADWITASGSNKVNVQLGCHFEEVAEMLDELVGEDDKSDEAIANAYDAVVALATQMKKGEVVVHIPDDNRDNFLDAICDQVVTGTGAATMLKMQVAEGLQRVNSSNWSKFVDGKPIFDANGKIAKGPNYVKANLKGLT